MDLLLTLLRWWKKWSTYYRCSSQYLQVSVPKSITTLNHEILQTSWILSWGCQIILHQRFLQKIQNSTCRDRQIFLLYLAHSHQHEEISATDFQLQKYYSLPENSLIVILQTIIVRQSFSFHQVYMVLATTWLSWENS